MNQKNLKPKTEEIGSDGESEESRTYNIMVYGVEKVELHIEPKTLKQKNYHLTFEPFDTLKSFSDFDGVMLFQGIFESFRLIKNQYGQNYYDHNFDEDTLDQRKKEAALLQKKGGFICFLLWSNFIDDDRYNKYYATDLTKYFLNYTSFHRKNFGSRRTIIKSKRNEFGKFFENFGGAYSYFNNYNSGLEVQELAKADREMVAMIISDNEFFIPSMLPKNIPERIEDYFKLLAEALTTTLNKLFFEIPSWIESFKFSSELKLQNEKEQLETEIVDIENNLKKLKSFKRILMHDGELLVNAVIETLKKGFGLNINETDDLREDFKINGSDGNPIIFGEIKGTNAGVKREHVNQADSHRERAELPSEFPSILIINTNIKNSRTLKEKDKEVPQEQIIKAKRENILVLRTLDLLNLLNLYLDKKITQEGVLKLFQENSGWLKVSGEDWEIKIE